VNDRLIEDLYQRIQKIEGEMAELKAVITPPPPQPGALMEAEHQRLRERGRAQIARVRRLRGEEE
jgi:hypothetical protein